MERSCSFKTRPPYPRDRGSGSCCIGGLVGPESIGTFWEKVSLLSLLRFEIRIVQLVVPAHQIKIKKDGKFCKKYPESTDKGKMIRQRNIQEAETCLAVWNRTEVRCMALLSSAQTLDMVLLSRQSITGKMGLPPLSVHISSQLITVAGEEQQTTASPPTWGQMSQPHFSVVFYPCLCASVFTLWKQDAESFGY